MGLLQLIVILVVIGVALWGVNTYVTFMDPKIKRLMNIAVVVIVALWLFTLVFPGFWPTGDIPVRAIGD
jgi:hypothetical protein